VGKGFLQTVKKHAWDADVTHVLVFSSWFFNITRYLKFVKLVRKIPALTTLYPNICIYYMETTESSAMYQPPPHLPELLCLPLLPLQLSRQSVQWYLTAFANGKKCGQARWCWRRWSALGTWRRALNTVIPTTRGTSFRGLTITIMPIYKLCDIRAVTDLPKPCRPVCVFRSQVEPWGGNIKRAMKIAIRSRIRTVQ
jgi:hypothetical protein